MATETGTVTKTDADTAWVRTKKSSSCAGCASKDSCSTLGGREMEVAAINTVNAREGDTVVIRFETGSLLKASFLIHVFPIICLIIGAFIGQKFAPDYGLNPSFLSPVLGFLFLGLSFIFVRKAGNKMSEKDEYRPKIIRIRRKGVLSR